MTPKRPLTLSASTLSLFKECPRCFWLQFVKGIHRPATIFPSLPGGMDGVIKMYFDKYRARGLPPEIKGKVEGKLLKDQELLNRWRSRAGGLWYEDKKLGVRLMGLLDDCLVDRNVYIPLDYKTRGYPPRDDSSRFYEHQLDIYTFLLKENGHKTKSLGYLVYFWPEEVQEKGMVQFVVEPKQMETDPARAYKLFVDAVMTLRGGVPARHSTCGFCSWGEHQHEFTA